MTVKKPVANEMPVNGGIFESKGQTADRERLQISGQQMDCVPYSLALRLRRFGDCWHYAISKTHGHDRAWSPIFIWLDRAMSFDDNGPPYVKKCGDRPCFL
jgi:hypothetical protein